MEKEEKIQKSVQFPEGLLQAIEQLAKENERSFSAEVVYAMRQYIRQQRRERDRENWGESVSG